MRFILLDAGACGWREWNIIKRDSRLLNILLIARLKLSPWKMRRARKKEHRKGKKIKEIKFLFISPSALLHVDAQTSCKIIITKNNFSVLAGKGLRLFRKFIAMESLFRIDAIAIFYLETGDACWDWLSEVVVDGRIAVAAWLLSCV